MGTRWTGMTLALLGLGLVAVAAHAQPAAAPPDLRELVFQWARGDFRSPLLCDFDGRPVRGLRRVLIAPGPKRAFPPVLRLQLFSLDAGDASRCFDELGVEQPDIVATLFASYPSRTRADMALREFKEALRRDGGFELKLERGRIDVRDLTGAATPESLDVAGGVARLSQIHPGSDAARQLSDLASPRKLELMLELPGGRRFAFPMAQAALR